MDCVKCAANVREAKRLRTVPMRCDDCIRAIEEQFPPVDIGSIEFIATEWPEDYVQKLKDSGAVVGSEITISGYFTYDKPRKCTGIPCAVCLWCTVCGGPHGFGAGCTDETCPLIIRRN